MRPFLEDIIKLYPHNTVFNLGFYYVKFVTLLSLVMVHVFENDATLRNVFLDLCLQCSFAANQKASLANWKLLHLEKKWYGRVRIYMFVHT